MIDGNYKITDEQALEAIRFVSLATNPADCRGFCRYIHHVPDKGMLVGTDGHRLHVVSIDLETLLPGGAFQVSNLRSTYVRLLPVTPATVNTLPPVATGDLLVPERGSVVVTDVGFLTIGGGAQTAALRSYQLIRRLEKSDIDLEEDRGWNPLYLMDGLQTPQSLTRLRVEPGLMGRLFIESNNYAAIIMSARL